MRDKTGSQLAEDLIGERVLGNGRITIVRIKTQWHRGFSR
jgi:hypothetical protein